MLVSAERRIYCASLVDAQGIPVNLTNFMKGRSNTKNYMLSSTAKSPAMELVRAPIKSHALEEAKQLYINIAKAVGTIAPSPGLTAALREGKGDLTADIIAAVAASKKALAEQKISIEVEASVIHGDSDMNRFQNWTILLTQLTQESKRRFDTLRRTDEQLSDELNQETGVRRTKRRETSEGTSRLVTKTKVKIDHNWAFGMPIVPRVALEEVAIEESGAAKSKLTRDKLTTEIFVDVESQGKVFSVPVHMSVVTTSTPGKSGTNVSLEAEVEAPNADLTPESIAAWISAIEFVANSRTPAAT